MPFFRQSPKNGFHSINFERKKGKHFIRFPRQSIRIAATGGASKETGDANERVIFVPVNLARLDCMRDLAQDIQILINYGVSANYRDSGDIGIALFRLPGDANQNWEVQLDSFRVDGNWNVQYNADGGYHTGESETTVAAEGTQYHWQTEPATADPRRLRRSNGCVGGRIHLLLPQLRPHLRHPPNPASRRPMRESRSFPIFAGQ